MAMPSLIYRNRFRLLALWESPVSQLSHRLVLPAKSAILIAIAALLLSVSCLMGATSQRK